MQHLGKIGRESGTEKIGSNFLTIRFRDIDQFRQILVEIYPPPN